MNYHALKIIICSVVIAIFFIIVLSIILHINSIAFSDWIAIIIGGVGLIISLVHVWYNYFRFSLPEIACSRWTAIKLAIGEEMGSTFAIKIAILNTSARPIKVFDFFLLATDEEGKVYKYSPLLFFDYLEFINDKDPNNKIYRAQKGQVPLPFILDSKKLLDFDYNILFMPYQNGNVVKPDNNKSIKLEFFIRTNQQSGYLKAASQKFSSKDLLELHKVSFVSVDSDESSLDRDSFLKSIG